MWKPSALAWLLAVTLMALPVGACGDAPTPSAPNRAPTVGISSPADGSTFTEGQPIAFQGSASNPEDGSLSGSSLRWTSNLHGEIGTGTSFSRNDLAVGTQNITLTATDGQGSTGSATIGVTVNPERPIPCDAPPSGLVSWWDGDGDASDIQGGHHGTLLNGATFAPGQVGQAFRFDGSDDMVAILSSRPSANSFTVEAWVWMGPVSPANGYRTLYADASSGFWLLDQRINWWQDVDRFLGNAVIPLGEWHHVALTYANDLFTGYVDGQPDGTTVFAGASLPTGSDLGIGGHSEASEFFDGLIDEIGIFNRALSAEEIAAIFYAGSDGKCGS